MNSDTNPNARNPTDSLTDEHQVQQQNESPETSRAAEVTGMEDASSRLDSSPIRFNPTDKELITDFLLKKIKNEDLPNNTIVNLDVFKHHPKTIIENHPQAEVGVWYFFSPKRNEKKGAYGQWYVGGTKKKISDDNGAKIGERSRLQFHEPDRTKTDIRMHMYIATNNQRDLLGEPAIKLDDYMLCLCKIYVRKSDREKLQLPALNQPVLPFNQVANPGNLQFQNNFAVQYPVARPPAPSSVIPPSPVSIGQFYPGGNKLNLPNESYATLDFNWANPSYNPQERVMTPPPFDHVDDEFVLPEIPDLDFFTDDDNGDGGSNLG